MDKEEVRSFVVEEVAKQLGISAEQVSDDTIVPNPRDLFLAAVFRYGVKIRYLLGFNAYSVGEAFGIIWNAVESQNK